MDGSGFIYGEENQLDQNALSLSFRRGDASLRPLIPFNPFLQQGGIFYTEAQQLSDLGDNGPHENERFNMGLMINSVKTEC